MLVENAAFATSAELSFPNFPWGVEMPHLRFLRVACSISKIKTIKSWPRLLCELFVVFVSLYCLVCVLRGNNTHNLLIIVVVWN